MAQWPEITDRNLCRKLRLDSTNRKKDTKTLQITRNEETYESKSLVAQKIWLENTTTTASQTLVYCKNTCCNVLLELITLVQII